MSGNQMHPSLLLIGFSSIASRRVVPAVRELRPDNPVDIATLSQAAAVEGGLGVVFSDYDVALKESRAETVYISLPNMMHFVWAKKALESGRHVIVDKPAFMSLRETEQLASLASKLSRCIAEATVFNYHRQFSEISQFFDTHGPLDCVSAEFIIPPMPAKNFRNHAELGGGCLSDMGPYAAALIRLFGSPEAGELHAISGPVHDETGVDASFSFLAGTSAGVRISGHFGFRGEYQNRIRLMGKGGSLTIERAFSPPPDFSPEWEIKASNQLDRKAIAADDTFRNFLSVVFDAVEKQSFSFLAEDMLTDAKIRDQLTSLARSEKG